MISFKQSALAGLQISNPTSLQFGPDGKLYVSETDGSILVLTVSGDPTSGYSVSARETIELVKSIPNHNDDGTFNALITSRQVTGILVTGTASNPVIYVSSSDPRIGGGSSGGDKNLDTNSGILSRLTLEQGVWAKKDLVIGLPRSEENHAVNGLQIDPVTGHILLAVGGTTNVGAPSQEFAYFAETAYSSAIVRIDIAAIDAMADKNYRGHTYKYALPTVDDPTRAAAGDIVAAGQPEVFGGNDGLNQARLTVDSPVQIYSPGYRNLYDLVVTESGQIYGIDNSGNPTWGGPPMYRQADGTISTTPSPDVTNVKNDGSGSVNKAPLHLIEEGYYAGHANPIRANPTGAGLYNPDGTPIALPSDWPPVPASMANPIEGYYLPPTTARGPRLPDHLETPLNLRSELATFLGSVNGIDDYRSSAFNGEMKGDLIAASLNDDTIYRIDLSADGKTVLGVTKLNADTGLSGGGNALDVHAAPENGPFAGTLWVASYGGGITVLSPDVGTNPDPVSEDTDGDGLNNIIDPFGVDPTNGFGVVLQGGSTLKWSFSQNEAHPGPGGIGNLGFTGVMINGVSPYTALYDPNKTIMGGAAAGVLMQDIGAGTPTANNQTDAYQFGIKAAPDVEAFTVTAKVNNPFDSTVATNEQSVGFFVGTGDQANYVQLVAAASTVNGVANSPTIKLMIESNNALVSSQTIQAPVFGAGAPAITASDHFLLNLTVNPASGLVTPSWTITRGSTVSSPGELYSAQGTAVQVGGELLNALQGTRTLTGTNGQAVSSGIAIGIIGTSDGPGEPFSTTWSSIEITSTAKQVGTIGLAELLITPGGSIDVSTFDRGTIALSNLSSSGSDLVKMVIDTSNAILPDGIFFDPAGAGGSSGKGFQLNSQTGAFTASASYQNGSSNTGYRQLTVDFNGLNPGEGLTFSIDIDPDSMLGYPQSVTPGAISGAELAGSRVTFFFADGSQTQGDVLGSGVAQAEATGFASLRAAPTLLLQGVTAGNVLFPAADPSVTVIGSPGSTVRVQMMAVAQQFAEFSSDFGGNNATEVTYETIVLDANGRGTVSATLVPDQVVIIAAAEVNPSGRAVSAVSPELRVVQGTEAPTTGIVGTENDDNLIGTSQGETIDARGGNDRITPGAGNDTVNGGLGVDTLVLSGGRANYSFTRSGEHLLVQDNRAGADGNDVLLNLEAIEFQGGFVKPINTREGSHLNEVLQGTSGADFFLFDTGSGFPTGVDTIRGLASGDRLVTTTAIYDSNNDGLIRANSSDRFVLPATAGSDPSQSVGTLKLYSATGSLVSNIRYLGSEQNNGVTFFVYAAAADSNTTPGLSFANVDTTPPTLGITTSRSLIGVGDSALLTLTFSEVPSNFTVSDLVVESGSLGVLSVTTDPRVFTVTYNPASNTQDSAMLISVAPGTYSDAAGNPGGAASLSLSVNTVPSYTGDGAPNTFIAGTSDNWTIKGLGGNDTLAGAGGADTLLGGADDDRLTGGGGNDLLDGELGLDTAVFSGKRGDYSFSRETGLVVRDTRLVGDGTDRLMNIERAEFQGGFAKPINVSEGTYLNDLLQGTSAQDTFLFDTAVGLYLGVDTIKNFGAGDRFITTSPIFDSNNDGIIRGNSSDRFLLPGVFDGGSAESTGTLKLFTASGRAISTIAFNGTDTHDGVTYYVYSAAGDAIVTADLNF